MTGQQDSLPPVAAPDQPQPSTPRRAAAGATLALGGVLLSRSIWLGKGDYKLALAVTLAGALWVYKEWGGFDSVAEALKALVAAVVTYFQDIARKLSDPVAFLLGLFGGEMTLAPSGATSPMEGQGSGGFGDWGGTGGPEQVDGGTPAQPAPPAGGGGWDEGGGFFDDGADFDVVESQSDALPPGPPGALLVVVTDVVEINGQAFDPVSAARLLRANEVVRFTIEADPAWTDTAVLEAFWQALGREGYSLARPMMLEPFDGPPAPGV